VSAARDVGPGSPRPSPGWPAGEGVDVAPAAQPSSTGDTAENRLAAAARRLTSVVVGRRLAPADLDATTAALTDALDRLEASGDGKRPRRLPRPGDHPQDYFPTSPVIGWSNPLAPPVAVRVVEVDGRRELAGTVTFDYPYEGPPTCVHGGVIAMVFDELLGALTLLTGHAGMTGTLTTRYRRPTPLLVELRFEARLVKVSGRKATAWCGLYRDDELTAEAQGVFITMRPDRMLKVAAEHAPSAGGDVLDRALAAAVERADQTVAAPGDPPDGP